MKIAVTAKGTSLDDQVDPRFGRCAYFLIVDVETMEAEAVENPSVNLGGGAGIQSAQSMADYDVKAVLTGNCGPNAFQTLSAAGIEVIVGVSGRIRDAVEQLKAGTLSSTPEANVASHFGMGGGPTGTIPQPAGQNYPPPGGGAGPAPSFGMGRGRGGGMGGGRGGGMGRGMGRGRGMGQGRGMGRGMGRGFQPGAPAAPGEAAMSPGMGPGVPPAPPTGEDELDALKAQAQAMEEQLQATKERIAQIEQGARSVHLIAVVNAEECTACGACEAVCPEGAITLETVAHVDTAKCTGCGECVAVCPQEAVTLKRA